MASSLLQSSSQRHPLPSLKSISLLLLLLHLVAFLQVHAITYERFDGDSQDVFQRMVTDDSTGSIYVGSVNRLYKLSSNLSVEVMKDVGPEQDNPACPPPPFDCEVEKRQTDNVNKALVIDKERDRVISCGSIFQGVCKTLALSDLADVEESNVEVVTNTAQGTNVAFIAPGTTEIGNVLYTGASLGKWLRSTPTVAKRHLHSSSKLFSSISFRSIPVNTIDSSAPSVKFDIDYKYGFSSGKFSYFIATQVEDFKLGDSPLYTKIVRLCHQDDSAELNSFVEVPLVCKVNDIIYNLVQSAYVSKVGSDLHDDDIQPGEDVLFVTANSSSDSEELQDKSAICMYSVRTINEGFFRRIEECAQGFASTDIDWLGTTTPCQDIQESLDTLNATADSYCHTSGVNAPLGGVGMPIEKQSIYTSTTPITAIIATPHNEATVLLLGDNQGNLKKLHVKSPTQAQLYEELSVTNGSPVLHSGLMLDADKQYVYVLTERNISKVPMETCERRTSCEECLMPVIGDVRDPHCGWCSLQTSCTRRSAECPGSTGGFANRWISQPDNCISVQSVSPASIPSDSTAMLTLEITSLPELSENSVYECVFDGQHKTPAVVTTLSPSSQDSSILECSTPSYQPVLQGGNLQVPLSIRANETGNLVTNTTFDFYKCSAFDSCSACVGDFLCNWCIFESRCTGNASTCRNSTQVVAGRMVDDVQTEKKGMDFCPRITDSREILIPAGIPEQFEFDVTVNSLPVKDGYECVLEHEVWRESMVTPAEKIDDTTIRCRARLYNYTLYVGSITVNFYIRWNNGLFRLDGSPSLTVVLYKCSVGRATCGSCLTTGDSFDCGWCMQSSACTMMNQCPGMGGSQGLEQGWLSKEGLCPDPHITAFYPRTGHVAGGTLVTIDGYNLGQTQDDITNITIAGMPCTPCTTEYALPGRIACKTNRTNTPATGPIEIMIARANATTMTISKDVFSFVEPKITSFRPQIGPKAGGTRILLFGVHLDAGVNRTVMAVGKPCLVKSSSNLSNNVTCLTSPGEEEETGRVVMTFDQNGTAESGSNFTYKKNPTITDIARISTILSGGIDLQVMGTDLTVVQEPKMVLHWTQGTRSKRDTIQAVSITTPCTTTTSTVMQCKSPDLNSPELAGILVYRNTTPPSIILDQSLISFLMDGVPNLKSNRDLVVYADPEYFMFEEEGHLRKLEYGERRVIEIKGLNIAQTYMNGDVVIRVGEEDCTTVMMPKENLLTCEAPELEVGKTYDVVVYHGNLVASVGRLEYLAEQLPLSIIIGAACGLALLLLGLLVIVCICRRFSKNKRRLKKMEQQRDQMEMRVAQECKDAFAELQITVLTVSSDVEGSGIPFRDYRDYAARVLFPENPNHHVFRQVPVTRENISGFKRDVLQKGLVQFGQLINNQTFLTVFIRTLEGQQKLGLKERSNIASLLVIALHNKMDYLTEAMKTLLQQLIKGYIKEGTPQLLLRRSDAVVEKLVSHWLSLLMYDSLKESMGKSLFHLFYAIKQQIDKGPVDAVTGEARYGLSEMKVIRQQIDFKMLNIFTNSLESPSESIQLKVLDCDTISQTKDKILDAIYKTCPFSERPTRDELDLEWSDRPQGSGSVILLDDDGRGFDGEWRRLNTLARYGVTDGATLRLVRAQPNGGSLPNSPARNYGLGTLQTSPATSASPIIDQERGSIPWHLVKHVDSGSLRKGERDQKMMAEIYLPRLLTTKGILQTFVDELLETIFNCDNYDSDPPLSVKYLFDFLDAQSTSHDITNNDVVHAWKSNCLQLRFWVNLIINPNILFDINKTDTVDACVSIIGQTLIDSCSVAEQILTKDSPSNKLLYAKDIPTYKQWVGRYYKDISEMATISDQDMGAMLTAHTNRYQHEFQPLNALNELYFCYACVYKSEILQALDEDKESQLQSLGDKLEDIFRLMADST